MLAIGALVTIAVVPTASHASPARSRLSPTPAKKSSSGSPSLSIKTLSARADVVSGKHVFTKIDMPSGAKMAYLKVKLNGHSIRHRFKRRGNGKVEGLIKGLQHGKNTVIAKVKGEKAKLKITDAPLGGPVFAGPQVQPWTCQSSATNAKCKRSVHHKDEYLPAGTAFDGSDPADSVTASDFVRYHPKHPPAKHDIATATTNQGDTVPFIIRRYSGYLDRDQFRLAMLYQPGKKWKPWAAQPQYNHRLVVTGGRGCDTRFGAGSAPNPLNARLLGAGYLIMSSALDNAGEDCNLVTEAESVVMVKQYVIDHFGTVRYTIGSGCSGGSVTQEQVANAYPGIYQGLTPGCSFPDVWSTQMERRDYLILLKYFERPKKWSKSVNWTGKRVDAVFDRPGFSVPVTFPYRISTMIGGPSQPCPDVPRSKVYSKGNPNGVKCDLSDYMRNVFGVASSGFAHYAFDNAGVQYGLSALDDGMLSKSDFVDVNSQAGGINYLGRYTKKRTDPDPTALRRAYQSGAVNMGNTMDKVAIIDLRGPDDTDIHDTFRSFSMQARLQSEFGTSANQVMWRGSEPLHGDPSFLDDSVFAMDEWLGAVHADNRQVPLATKIIEDKPADVTDRCTDGNGNEEPESVCDKTVPVYGSPRMAAGESIADDTLQCQLQPLSKSDYPVTFSKKQWRKLKAAFPNGVCNYNVSGMKEQNGIPWLTYQNKHGHVVYGGKPLGGTPKSTLES
jgi:hypothetical protein